MFFDYDKGGQNAHRGQYYVMLRSRSPGFSDAVALSVLTQLKKEVARSTTQRPQVTMTTRKTTPSEATTMLPTALDTPIKCARRSPPTAVL